MKYEYVRCGSTRRDLFDIKPGDKLVVLGEEGQGLTLVKESDFMAGMEAVMAAARRIAR